MADLTFRLENRDGTDTFDLLNGLRLIDGSYMPEAGSHDPITDVFEVMGTGIAGQLRLDNNDLEKEFLEKARLWVKDKWRYQSIWLRWMSQGENDKRVLVYDYAKKTLASPTANVFLEDNHLKLALALTRHWCFEEPAALTVSEPSVSAFGGMWNIATDSPPLSGGVVDGRIERLYFSSADALKRFWIGIKPVSGTTTFTPLFECETSATNYIADTASAVDAAASNGNAKQTTYATQATMAYRFGRTLGTTVDRDDLIGRYVVLLRCGLSASGGTHGIRLSTSWENPTGTNIALQRLSTQYITHTNYKLVEMGEIEIPPGGYRNVARTAVGSLRGLYLNIEAERLSGVANLLCDCFLLIPAEHYCHLDGAAISAGTEFVNLLTNEDDSQQAYIYNSSTDTARYPESNFTNWSYPKDGGLLVLAAERDTIHDMTDEILTPEMWINKRWLTYAG